MVLKASVPPGGPRFLYCLHDFRKFPCAAPRQLHGSLGFSQKDFGLLKRFQCGSLVAGLDRFLRLFQGLAPDFRRPLTQLAQHIARLAVPHLGVRVFAAAVKVVRLLFLRKGLFPGAPRPQGRLQ